MGEIYCRIVYILFGDACCKAGSRRLYWGMVAGGCSTFGVEVDGRGGCCSRTRGEIGRGGSRWRS